MASKTLIGGTAYEIGSGKTLVNGTAYEISGGKTLVGGTAYEVGFKVVVTLTSTQTSGFASQLRASVEINGITYKTENCEIKVKKGSIITCSVEGTMSTGTQDSGTGQIFLNGVEIVNAYGCTKTCEYVVQGDVAIHLETIGSGFSPKAGVITITEQY